MASAMAPQRGARPAANSALTSIPFPRAVSTASCPVKQADWGRHSGVQCRVTGSVTGTRTACERRSSTRIPPQESRHYGAASRRRAFGIRVRGDGNCLFRSIVQGYHMQSKGVGVRQALSKEEETVAAAALRSKVIQELKARRSDMEPFIDEDYDAYLAKMSRDGTWGGEPELAVAPHAIQMPIRVYSLVGSGQIQLLNEYGREYLAFGDSAVSVFFHGMGHYDLLASP
eukprot:CAMPEP_0177753080 /NCGR_PEP_ID=MMETSP0491_2-20121128/1263_1 /TAXON_ID=63592 /ORGANISM="Tetraselmis chuii, Strain PLY429" /LENGTH=228 /DNA_ID=CAMNT_0019268329 /DNA_START=130 /DNA_END=816 /DNA_ORIENTATION=+